jgi:hypothetical protein
MTRCIWPSLKPGRMLPLAAAMIRVDGPRNAAKNDDIRRLRHQSEVPFERLGAPVSWLTAFREMRENAVMPDALSVRPPGFRPQVGFPA